ncbi:5-dehydro-2-deoxygluconokinase [Corynebacterium pacaense]|uniref:5-dehydro-2-deoxygluconokinase n=1 Tax=Corynebacterium pacaense TaxID=1816684 RepID=UPI0009BAAF8A|nr:5-dehydro-2-deoxygluconokinase [Corynebacterium pacaense]
MRKPPLNAGHPFRAGKSCVVTNHAILAVGRCGVDVYPLQTGVTLEEVSTFGKFLGGSPMNVTVAAARYGEDCAILTGVGDDPFGRWVRLEMRRLGVSDEYVIVDPVLNTPVTFCEIIPPDHNPFFFYREPSAPDLQIRTTDIPEDNVRDARVVWFSGTGLSEEPSYGTHLEILKLRGAAAHTVFDLDWRPVFWKDTEQARQRYQRCLEQSTVAVGNLEECELAVGENDPERAAQALLDRGITTAVVKQGDRGTLARTADETVFVPAVHCRTLNGAGAGDAFGGALCHALIRGWDLERTIRFANAAGAIVASRLECSTAMPTEAEVERVLGAGTTDVLEAVA